MMLYVAVGGLCLIPFLLVAMFFTEIIIPQREQRKKEQKEQENKLKI